MKVITKALLAVLALALFAAVPARAQEQGWYVGAGAGLSTVDGACDGISGPGISCDEQSTAFKIFGGYQFNRHFALEGGYTDLGKAKASFAGFGDATIGATGFEALAVGLLPINAQWSAYGKIGLYSWDAKFNDGTGLVGSASATGTDLTWALGMRYAINKNLGLRLEFQQYNDVGDPNTTGQGDIQVLGVGLTYHF